MYVTGIDVYGSLNTVSRSDVNLIVTVNPKTKQILMTSIPRDCEINLHSNVELDKLTHTGNYGTAETINTIQDLLDMEINYFVRTNFSGMTNIVDFFHGQNHLLLNAYVLLQNIKPCRHPSHLILLLYDNSHAKYQIPHQIQLLSLLKHQQY